MSKMISIDDSVTKCLDKLREYYADADEGKLASYTTVIKKALKKSNMWSRCRKNH